MSDWQFTFGDKSFLLEDLPIDELEAIGKRHGVAWFDLWNRPSANAAAFIDLITTCAGKVGAEPPPLAKTSEVLAYWRDNFDLVNDDRPSEYEEGVPLAEDDQATDSLSGAPSGSGGPQT